MILGLSSSLQFCWTSTPSSCSSLKVQPDHEDSPVCHAFAMAALIALQWCELRAVGKMQHMELQSLSLPPGNASATEMDRRCWLRRNPLVFLLSNPFPSAFKSVKASFFFLLPPVTTPSSDSSTVIVFYK